MLPRDTFPTGWMLLSVNASSPEVQRATWTRELVLSQFWPDQAAMCLYCHAMHTQLLAFLSLPLLSQMRTG